MRCASPTAAAAKSRRSSASARAPCATSWRASAAPASTFLRPDHQPASEGRHMSNLEIDRVLAQIRSMSQAGKAGGVGGIGGAGGAGPNGVAGIDNGFAKILKQGIDSVNSTQTRASDLANKF